jgi:hypothetical protein
VRQHLPELTMVFLRGWLMVSLVALNTVQIAHGRTLHAMVVGFCISYLWWGNSSRYRSEARWAGVVYATGAALGTLTGIWIGWNWG